MRTLLSRRRFLECGALAALGVSTAARAVDAPRREPKRRIGFVDDDLNNYHADVFLQAARGPLKERGFRVTGCTGLKKEEGQVWAEKNGVPWLDTAEALDAVVDFYMVLAPSTPETHLELCRRVFPFSKPVYVDKTFAPDLPTAREIFALADRHGTPIQTSSALRYSNVQEEARNLDPNEVEHMITWGAGGSFAEYAIHPVELLISLMGAEAARLMRRGPEHRSQLLLEFAGNRTGVVNVYTRSNTPFAASVTTAKQTRYIEVDVSKIFVNTMAAQLDFFELGEPQVDRRETLAIMGILDAAREEKDAWHQLR